MSKLPEHIKGGEIPPARVYLDGVEVNDVCEVHTGEGWLIQYQRDAQGALLVRDGDVVTETRRGCVTVELIGGEAYTEAETSTN